MAFHQPTRALAPQRPSISTPAESATAALTAPQQQAQLEESQEWVLFSPSTATSTRRTRTSLTEETRHAASLTRLSDFGSLDTAARSDDEEELESEGTADATAEADEEGDLDSLDDGLHAFREPPVFRNPYRKLHQSEGIFPTHDGLGTFPASGSPVQEQLWQFEQYNPQAARERHRRASSVQQTLDALEDEVGPADRKAEKIQRIERWRMEQSRALLDEIEKETRRRRMSRTSIGSARRMSLAAEESVTMGDTEGSLSGAQDEESDDNEPFWKRITRRVIRDLIGIDEALLSVIFGESLPADVQGSSEKVQAGSFGLGGSQLSIRSAGWEDRLLERIARELGTLVHQLAEHDHPGAFSTYLRTQEAPPYAGLPSIIPASEQTPPTETSLESTTGPHFSPTLPTLQSAPSLPESSSTQRLDLQQESDRDRQYWEQDLDIKLVFSFLRKRFSSRPNTPPPTQSSVFPPPQLSDTTHLSSSNKTLNDPARRAALIRQHHPLVSQAHTHKRNHDQNLNRTPISHHIASTPNPPSHAINSSPTRPAGFNLGLGLAPGLAKGTATGTSTISHPSLKRRSSSPSSYSCASQSRSLGTKASKTGRSRNSGSRRSANYWDLGGDSGGAGAGAGGSSSVISAVGGWGWGEGVEA
ncbi:MAG: hypothetical protein M1819_000969 [Sarea resinae]|nr:MAG: hypothetical protein M1819_000969 [Sarea resinae]